MRLSAQLTEAERTIARLTAENAKLAEQNAFCLSEIERYRNIVNDLTAQLKPQKQDVKN
jgi:hypothetical protein